MTNDITCIVGGIIREVERGGDSALCSFARRFDKIRMRPQDLRVRPGELKEAVYKVSKEFRWALQECAKNVKRFAESEKNRLSQSWVHKKGSVRVGQLIRPIDSVGLYIPGGRYPYPSTVLMSVIPARVAGVRRVIMSSPPAHLTLEVMAAAQWSGVDEVYRIGGAGAIAAMALGTRSIKRVDFVGGPGNQYVTEAKRQLFGKVGVDLLAGPSEVVIIADRSTPVSYIESDLRAQMEHDPSAKAALFSTDRVLLGTIRRRLGPVLVRRMQLGYTQSLKAAVEQANAIAPEHLELLFRNPARYLGIVRNAGAVFIGPASPAALGDYSAGPSHVLPTNGAAHFSSGLSVATFLKRSSVIGFAGRTSELRYWQAALQMAQTEGLQYHAASLRLRLARR